MNINSMTPGRSSLATLGRAIRMGALLVSGGAALVGAHAATALADQPLYTNNAVPGNLALALSVEFPTAIGLAHAGAFDQTKTYIGYFSPSGCYLYYSGTETGTDLSHFYRTRKSNGTSCLGTGALEGWHGNFLNWLMMQAIDPFRKALTGGYRVVDTPTLTILERAWADGTNGSDANFPAVGTTDRASPTSAHMTSQTPLAWTSMKASVRGRGNQVWITGTGALTNGTAGTPLKYTEGGATDASKIYSFYARVKSCGLVGGTADEGCKQYSESAKPEGLLQLYADKIRYSSFGYLNDPTDNIRDGGVLRAQQKFIGPNFINPGSSPTVNPRSEWDSVTGVMHLNPDAPDAANTATVFGVPVGNSGVMNYLNKFGQQEKTYKRRDPVGELYYGALRYLKNQGSVPEWSNIASDPNKKRLIDGFPVITNWADPIQYSCQRNFILGIGDTNTNWDFNLPGSTTNPGNEPARPASVTADTTVDVRTLTNKVGQLQGMGASLGTASIGSGSYFMAGLAYDANIRDIRPDDASKPQTLGKQTIQTYWLDVLEFGSYANNNQFLLAAKYGGFKVSSYYEFGDPLTTDWWRTTTDLTPNGQPRPDNYYTVARADQMVDGLTRAFSSIAAALRAYTTSFSTALPQVSTVGNASYAAQFDSESWLGEVTASELSFDAVDGTPFQSERWTFSSKLKNQIITGNGWDTNRRIITQNTVTNLGVPFRIANLSSEQVSALDTPFSAGNDSQAFLNYLRGSSNDEVASAYPGSLQAYRKRLGYLGDVVNSKSRPVGPPNLILSNASNAGYGAYKTARATRPTVVYLGSNAGVLHAINGSLTGADAGKEMFAYVPSDLFKGPSGVPATDGLVALGNPTFQHHYYVNATPGAFDVDFAKTTGGSGAPDWRTIIIGGLGKGGKSYYALDVTDPNGMIAGAGAAAQELNAATKVLWEFRHPDLGYTFGEPIVVKSKRHGGKWVALLPSGYNNTDDNSFIFVLNPKTGQLIEKIRVGSSSQGLAHLNAFVLDRTHGIADAIYAGDINGNIWRAELNTVMGTVDANMVDSDYKALAFAKLTNGTGAAQPVTTRPLIEIDPLTGRRFVLVGTGLMLDSSHVVTNEQQSFYAIVDGRANRYSSEIDLPSGVTFPIQRNKLANNTDLIDGTAYNTTTQIGWYVELGFGNGSAVSRRIVNDPSSAFGGVVFSTVLPSSDVCIPAGTSRIYAINFGSGQSLLTVSGQVVNFNETITGVVTDLRFFTVNGVPRLIVGSDSGEVRSAPGNFGGPSPLRQLNWREVPVAN